MGELTEDVAIEYGIFVGADSDAMAGLLAEVFTRHDPPAVAVGLTVSEFDSFVRMLCPMAASEGLTTVARLAESGELVGAILTLDSASELPSELNRLSAKFNPIFDILGQLETEHRSGHAVPQGESIHLFLLGVSDRVAGRGVGKKLVWKCLTLGASRGYKAAVTEATNKTSQHIFQKLGFAMRVYRSYEEHRFEGREVFASIAEHGGPMLMDRSLAQ